MNNFIQEVILAELKHKKNLSIKSADQGGYVVRNINIPISLLFVVLIPVCYAHIYFLSKNKFFYLNIVKSDLTEGIIEKIGGVYKSERYKSIVGKLYLLPLRIYSHMIRREWVFNSSLVEKLLESLLANYLKIFIERMRGKIFFIREDYHAEASMLCSISQSIKTIKTIAFSHGSLSIRQINEEGLYPGQRANLQIVQDKKLFKCLNEKNPFHSKIILSRPCYDSVKERRVELNSVYFIGNNSLDAARELNSIAGVIRESFKDVKVLYKPHPSENHIYFSNMTILNVRDSYHLIRSKYRRVFVGQTSTLLYDAYMAGHIVYLMDQNKFPCVDSLAGLGSIPEITSENAVQTIASVKASGGAEYDGFEKLENARTIDEIAKIIINDEF